MSCGRALRVLFVANDGFSAGHVVRSLGVMRGLSRRARSRDVEVRALLATTSEAHELLHSEPVAVVLRLPAPAAARRGGFSDSERRRLVRGVLSGAIEAFGADVIVVDTFPSGPHGELANSVGHAKRVLVRRMVAGAHEEALTSGLKRCDLAILADDPTPWEAELPVPSVRVPPIVMTGELRSREESRAALGLPLEGRVFLVASGGGGDESATVRAEGIAQRLVRLDPSITVALAVGPLARESRPRDDVKVLRVAPLGAWLRAFDGAFAPAGYNTAHELAHANVKAALFAQPRPYDDQAARAARFAEASLAYDLRDEDGVADALAWMHATPPPSLAADGADRAADAILDLVMVRR